ncbi:MAG: DUF4062 domain-containing protein [Candidatus Pacebacteria bacterium]|nr:DUF4062 domain-containing protein [Candidatus Paceibacterota bacterium]
MSEIIYGVFVSSTYEDLREERAEVQKALLKLHCFPIGMELFGSADEETLEFIKRRIDECDYYVVIVADRYGSVAEDGVSFTEKEYDYAKSTKKPVLAFLREDRGKIERDKTETDPKKRERLDCFIKKISHSPVSYFISSHELALQVTTSFVNERERHPAVGYIRTDQTVNLKKYTDLLEQKADIESQLAVLRRGSEGPFLHAQDLVTIKYLVKPRAPAGQTKPNEKPQNFEKTKSYSQLFLAISRSILLGSDEIQDIKKNVLYDLSEMSSKNYIVEYDNEYAIETVIQRLFGWRLITIEIQHRKRPEMIMIYKMSDGDEYHDVRILRLTEYGQEQFGFIM